MQPADHIAKSAPKKKFSLFATPAALLPFALCALVIFPAAIATSPALAAETCPNEVRRAEQPFGQALPDCRAYEMVSPVETGGQDATDGKIFGVQRAAVSGEALTYESRGAFGGSAESAIVENQYISRRGSDGWSTQSIVPPHEPDGAELQTSYEASAFTPELTEGLASSNASLAGTGAPVTVSGGGYREQDLYLTAFDPGVYEYIGQSFQPEAASSDLTHIVLGESGHLSEWINGHTVKVGVENNGTEMNATAGMAAQALSAGFDRQKDAWQAASADGSRVYFTSPATAGSENQLYIRVNAEQSQSPMSGETCTNAADACTIEVSASQRGTPDPNGPQPARYWGASASGALVYFTSRAELTNNAYTGTADNAANLYEYDVEDGRLTDLTVDPGEAAEGASVQGVAQISGDGAYVYFVADGDLAAGATPGQPNLYVSHEGGTPVFIGTLTSGDQGVWASGSDPEVRAGPAINMAAISENGQYLAFVSEAHLTSYDNEQSRSGECEGEIIETALGAENGHCLEVYLYDSSDHSLACVSCNASGAQPIGPSRLRQLPDYAFAEYRPRNVLDDGTVFFDSADQLVPRTSDGLSNVYEYEDGRVYAVSNVAGGSESFFLDSAKGPHGEEGGNVFFATEDQLLPEDPGGNVVVYDARVDGGFPVVTPVPSCDDGDSCKPPPSVQPGVFGAPASATFSGPGNLTTSVSPSSPSSPVVRVAVKKSVKCSKGKTRNGRGQCVRWSVSKKRSRTGKSRDRREVRR
jgi:hypothetical protein